MTICEVCGDRITQDAPGCKVRFDLEDGTSKSITMHNYHLEQVEDDS